MLFLKILGLVQKKKKKKQTSNTKQYQGMNKLLGLIFYVF